MSILIGLFISVLSFFIGFSLKASRKMIETEIKKRERANKKKSETKKPADIIRNKISRGNKNDKSKKGNNKLEILTNKALKLALRSIDMAKAFLKTLGVAITLLFSFLASVTLSGGLVVLMCFVLIVSFATTLQDKEIGGTFYIDNGTSTTSSSTSSGTNQDYVITPINADVKQIIDMSETEVWQLISEGRFKSYDEANKAAKADMTGEKQYWTALLTTVECPAWKWKDDSKTEKVSGTVKITVNKYLAEYFKAFLTDIYKQPNQYVIYSAGGFNFRTKNNGTGTSNLSAHSFGTVLDINPQTDGMGSNAVSGFGSGIPWNSDQGLSEPCRSEACAFNGNWYNVAKKYRLDWGGLWSKRSLDPMHFSIVGDTKRDTRTFTPKSSGADPR